jgi:hypothetical protein
MQNPVLSAVLNLGKSINMSTMFGCRLHEKVQEIINIDPIILNRILEAPKLEFFCPVIYFFFLGHLSNSNFVVLRVALSNCVISNSLSVLAALVVHALPYSVMQAFS